MRIKQYSIVQSRSKIESKREKKIKHFLFLLQFLETKNPLKICKYEIIC